MLDNIKENRARHTTFLVDALGTLVKHTEFPKNEIVESIFEMIP